MEGRAFGRIKGVHTCEILTSLPIGEKTVNLNMTIKIIFIFDIIEIYLVQRFKGGFLEEGILEMSPVDRQELTRPERGEENIIGRRKRMCRGLGAGGDMLEVLE